jgi:hypothetical protein
MPNNRERQKIVALVDESGIMFAGSIGVLLLFTLPTGSAGTAGLLIAALGAAVGGWMMTRPSAKPLSLTPHAPGFAQDVAEEERLFERLASELSVIRHQQVLKIRRNAVIIVGVLCLCALIRYGFSPTWIGINDLVLMGIVLFGSFLFGAGIVLGICWRGIYRICLRTRPE